ncbi:MAG: DUF4157 domain-containing protein [Paludibacteraceae bacterium]|nr:DUF4157 domain-containing protein [Paludibacteraceae bacterium]
MFVNESAMQGKVNTPSSQQNRSGNVSYPSRTIIHPKLELTEPGDSDEQEADAAASDVMSGKVCRKISGGGAGGGMAVSSQMESQLNHLQGGGQSMPAGLRGMMERGFDRDFSQVRLHTDSEAAGLSSSIHAKAFTHGNDIYFNRGQFSPETSEGQRLVAHELAHVAQGGGKVGRDGEEVDEIDNLRNYLKNNFVHREDWLESGSIENSGVDVLFNADGNYTIHTLNLLAPKGEKRKVVDCDVYMLEALSYLENEVYNKSASDEDKRKFRESLLKIFPSFESDAFQYRYDWDKDNKGNNRVTRVTAKMRSMDNTLYDVDIPISVFNPNSKIKLGTDGFNNLINRLDDFADGLQTKPISGTNPNRIYYPLKFKEHYALLFNYNNKWYVSDNDEVKEVEVKDKKGKPQKEGEPQNIDDAILYILSNHGYEFEYYFFNGKKYDLTTKTWKKKIKEDKQRRNGQ